MKFLTLFAAVLIQLSATTLLSAKHYQVFVLTGQSNSLGTTNGGEPDPSPGDDPADAQVRFFWHNWKDAGVSIGSSGGEFKSLQQQQGGVYPGSATHWGPEIEFGRILYRAGVRDFVIVKVSRGGGGNSHWAKGSTDDHMYYHVVDGVTQATNLLSSEGNTFEVAGLLYLQGESDSPADAQIAGVRFDELMLNLRNDLPNASSLHGVIGGIANPGAKSDTVRAKHAQIASQRDYIDFFSNLDLQTAVAPDALHFNKFAKIRIGERFAQAFFAAGIVHRHYGKLVFIGDSITHGGGGDHPSYRYTVFKHLAEQGVPIVADTGYQFVGSVTGGYLSSQLTTPDVNGQTFQNNHDGHYGWRVSWEAGRLPLPAGRYNKNNLGSGTLENWTGQSQTFQTTDAPQTKSYTGTTYVPDTAVIMIGINDLADGVPPGQIRDDLGLMIDQLRAANPSVSIHLNRVLRTNQGAERDNQVASLNALLPALVKEKNTASSMSPVWLVDASSGFEPAVHTFDKVHPNTAGEIYVGTKIAAAMGIIESGEAPLIPSAPPHIEKGASHFEQTFQGNEIFSGTAFVNGWKKDGNQTTHSLGENGSTFIFTHIGTASNTLNGTTTGWLDGNRGDWTLEARLKFLANPNGFTLWMGTGNNRILVEIHANRVSGYDGKRFSANVDNLDGQFHDFRVAHESGSGRYHVWRDGIRLTPVEGVDYDQNAADARLLFGDYTSGSFGDHFSVEIERIAYQLGIPFLPRGADADQDGLPDAWEYQYFGSVVGAVASADDDGDGMSNAEEYLAGTDPKDATSRFKIATTLLDAEMLTLSFSSSAGRIYHVLSSEDLGISDPWLPILGPIAGTGEEVVVQVPRVANQQFYRIAVSAD